MNSMNLYIPSSTFSQNKLLYNMIHFLEAYSRTITSRMYSKRKINAYTNSKRDRTRQSAIGAGLFNTDRLGYPSY